MAVAMMAVGIVAAMRPVFVMLLLMRLLQTLDAALGSCDDDVVVVAVVALGKDVCVCS